MMRDRAARLTTLGATIGLAVVALCLTSSTGLGSGGDRRRRAKPVAPPRVDYTKFSHRTAAHQQECASCHKFPSANWKEVRKGEAAFPDVTEYPEHSSCLACHRKQFFARERPAPRICSVCHVGVTPRFTARRPFPNPLEAFRTSTEAQRFVSDFRVSFPHDTHLELLGQGPNESCATCHQTYQPQGDSTDEYVTQPPKELGDGFWLKKGTFKTWPDSHESCFACHSADSGPIDCAMCHKVARAVAAPRSDFDPGRATAMGVTDLAIVERWRRRGSSATFRHEGGLHTEVGCTSCHDVAAMDTTDERTTKVRVQSCGGEGGCHITATADEGGVLNFELERRKAGSSFRCEKCHLAFGTAPVPASHLDAVPKAEAE